MQYQEEKQTNKQQNNKAKQSCDLVQTINTISLKYLFGYYKQRKSFHPSSSTFYRTVIHTEKDTSQNGRAAIE